MNPCNEDPCLNGATCVANEDNTNVTCICSEGFQGRFCECKVFLTWVDFSTTFEITGITKKYFAGDMKIKSTGRITSIRNIDWLDTILLHQKEDDNEPTNYNCFNATSSIINNRNHRHFVHQDSIKPYFECCSFALRSQSLLEQRNMHAK